MIVVMVFFGFDGLLLFSEVMVVLSDEEIYVNCFVMEVGFGQIFDVFVQGFFEFDVECLMEMVIGVDGNEIIFYVYCLKNVSGIVLVIVYIYGGGMVIGVVLDVNYVCWCDELVVVGLIVVGVEFCNGVGKLGNYFFLVGLNDCVLGFVWIYECRVEFGVLKIVVLGESGGGNFFLVIVFKVKCDGMFDQIDGIYVQCFYILNVYVLGDFDLLLFIENDGYFFGMVMMVLFVKIYDFLGGYVMNFLVWLYYVEFVDFEGLLLYVILVNEFDLLCDEGLVYYWKLVCVGVLVVGWMVNGICYVVDMLMICDMFEVYVVFVVDIKVFVELF